MNVIPTGYGTRQTDNVELGVTRYDQVASLLISLLILIGISVLMLFVIWLTQTLEFQTTKWDVLPAERSSRQNELAGFDQEMEHISLAETPELMEPLLAVELQAVTSAATTLTASLDTSVSGSSVMVEFGPDAVGPVHEFDDDGRDDIVPRWSRWQIRWTSLNVETYARQLDFFKIELGAAGGKSTLDYAWNLSNSRPDTREGVSQDERRLYMSWKSGRLVEFDRVLVARAGIPTADRLILQFYPAEVENQLAWIEMENATRQGHSSVKEFRKTYFGVRPKGRGYEFYVADQQFRKAPR